MKLYSIDDYRIDKFCIDQYRLDNYRMDGAGGGGTIIDHSTPVTVINAAYDTSGNGGRKLIRLNGGNLYAAMRNGTTAWYIYKSTDNGGAWSLFKTVTETVNDIALATDGTNVYALISYSTSGVKFYSYNESGTALVSSKNVDNGQSAMGLCSLTVDSSGNLHAAWVSKNSTYPNSFNIRSAKSVDGGVTWTKQDGTAGVNQTSSQNTSGIDIKNPCIVISNGNPAIFSNYSQSTYYSIGGRRWTGSAWKGSDNLVYGTATYIQSNPSTVVAPNGTMGCAWQGYGATHASTYHIFFKPSTDDGATWGTLVDVAVGQNPSLTVDENNALFVQYDRGGVIYQKKSTDGGAIWGEESTIGTGTNASTSTYNKFTQPLSIWKGASSVLFAGVFEA